MGMLLTLLTVFSVFVVIVLGLMTFLNNTKSPANTNFLGICCGLSIWILANFLADNNLQGLFWSRVAFASITVATYFFFGFASTFPNKKNIPNWISWAVLASTIGLLIIEQTNYFIPSTFISGGVSSIETGSLYILFPMYLVFVFGGGNLILVRGIRKLERITQIRLKIVVTGMILMALVGMITNLLIPSLIGNDKFAGIGTLSTLIFVAFTAYAIVRHHLFDIRLLVARSLAYLFSLLSIAVIFIILTLGVTVVAVKGNLNSFAVRAIYAALAVTLAIVFPWLKLRFDKVTDKLFYRDSYDPQVLLGELNKVLVSTIELQKLLDTSSKIIADGLKADYCVFGIKESGAKVVRTFGTARKSFSPEDIHAAHQISPQVGFGVIVTDYLPSEASRFKGLLSKNDISVLVRLIPEFVRENGVNEGLGYILLGQKRSGNLYNSQDVKILGIIANELVIAIQNALQFEEIQRFNLTLQDRIEKATRELRQTNQKLLELDEAKDDFISMASHQLRTPLTSVKGYISMVLDGDAGRVNRQQAKMLRQAFSSSQRMVYLITDLLNISRLKTGRFVIDASPTDLSELAHEEIVGLQETAKLKDIKLIYKRPQSFPELMLDEVKIRQVIMNFIDNALYYTPAGGSVRVELEEKAAAVELRVVDDGIGVPKSEQHHLFTKFYRAGNARKVRPDGTGLGLFMAKKVISAQGGSILFSSREGHGSTFGFIFSKTLLGVPADRAGSIQHAGKTGATAQPIR